MMERYKEYKDSGVKWLGEIPSHWELCKIFGLFSENKRKNTAFLYKHAMQFNYGTIVDKNECFDTEETKEIYSNYSLINKGDIVINGLNLNYDFVSQRVAISPKNGIITSAYVVISPKVEINTYFYCYLFKNMDNMKIFHGMGTGVRKTLSYKELRNQEVLLPPLSEQDAIVRYLDSATSEIDKAIAMQQKMIDLLNERKQIIIQNAVTKGLDENVEMKESGVEWIGRIPKHWEVRRLRFLCDFLTGDKDTINRVDNGKYPFFVRSPQVERINSYSFDGEAILMAGDGVGAGKVFHYYNGKFDYHQRVYNLHNFRHVDGKFLFYYLKQNFKYIIERAEAKSTVDSVRIIMLKDFAVCFPSKSEQQQIVFYLDGEMQRFDTAITNCQRQITLLQERKQIIINEVVTGKVRVS